MATFLWVATAALHTISAQTAPRGGTLVVVVTDQGSGQPLPFADLFIERTASAAFANEDGRATFANLPAGQLQVRARRLGFKPFTAPATVRESRIDTLRVALVPLALRLRDVHVKDAVCQNRAPRAGDTAVIAILQQLQLNAERQRLLAEEYPWSSRMERIITNSTQVGLAPLMGQRRVRGDTVRIDTLSLTSWVPWRYEPGQLVVAHEDRELGVRDKLHIPQLADFADSTFIASHCYRFAGVFALDGQRFARVDFEPSRTIRTPDIRGSIYLDTATYQIKRSTFFLERPSPLKAGDWWTVQVDSWFREVRPGLAILEGILESTALRVPGADPRDPAPTSTERQRLIHFVFTGNQPGDPLSSGVVRPP